MNTELDNFQCNRCRTLCYYFELWYETELNMQKKIKLHKIYLYLIKNTPEIKDLFYNNDYYNDIIMFLNEYGEDKNDQMGTADLWDIKQTLLEKHE